MICPYCHQTIKDGVSFCPKCGQKIPEKMPSSDMDETIKIIAMMCPNCHETIREGALFCPKCGQKAPISWGKNIQLRYCKQCGKPCNPTQTLCDSCVQSGNGSIPPQKKRKRGWILPILLLVFVFLVAVAIGIALKLGMLQGGIETSPNTSPVTTESSQGSTDGANSKNPNQADESQVNNADSSSTVAEEHTPSQQTAEQPTSTEHYYEVIAADISWTDANEAAKKAGGHLATITSTIEYEEVSRKASESGLKYLWLGAFLTSSKMEWGDTGTWITNEKWDFENWYPAEPSKEDADGTKEYYLCLWNALYNENDIGWTFNDQRNDIVRDFPECVGKVGYIIEYGDGYNE